MTVVYSNHASGKTTIIQEIEWGLWGEYKGVNDSRYLVNKELFDKTKDCRGDISGRI